jgi:uncharacterized protein (DUF2252 family)
MIRDNPPTIYHSTGELARDEFHARVRDSFARYREILSPSVRVVLDHFKFKDAAVKVVGVGSVGTFCALVLLMASDRDPLFLQVKEARASVLEAYGGKSVFANHRERVVTGHRLMQRPATSSSAGARALSSTSKTLCPAFGSVLVVVHHL